MTDKKVNQPFLSLRHANFRYYWIGMNVSLIGTWMQNIAQPWLAYSLTKSPFLLSLIGTLQFAPVLFFSLFAGVVIDRFSKKKILLFTQSMSALITIILALLVSSRHIAYWHILLMATLLGVVNTLDMPTRQSFVIEMVGKEDLMNAIALNSMAFNVARVLGPAVAGVIMGAFGTETCFFINAFSYLAVVISLLFIRPIEVKKNNDKGPLIKEIKDGLQYIKQTPVLMRTLFLVAIAGTFAPNFSVLVPVFAKEILNQGESGFGLLMSFLGAGSFLGAMFIASSSKNGPQRKWLYALPWLVGVFLTLTGAATTYMLTAIGLALTGFFFVTFSSTANSTMQLTAANEYRGRVMSVYTLIFAGSTPLGNLFAGIVSEHLGARAGFYGCGLMIIVLMMILTIKERVSAR